MKTVSKKVDNEVINALMELVDQYVARDISRDTLRERLSSIKIYPSNKFHNELFRIVHDIKEPINSKEFNRAYFAETLKNDVRERVKPLADRVKPLADRVDEIFEVDVVVDIVSHLIKKDAVDAAVL